MGYDEAQEIFSLLRTVRHYIDHGTGNALAQPADGTGADQDNDCAIRNRLQAHDHLTSAEQLIEKYTTLDAPGVQKGSV